MGYLSRPLILALLAILTKSEELNESGKSNFIADKLMQIETSSCFLLLHHFRNADQSRLVHGA